MRSDAPSYSCLDATKDRSVVDRLFELGLGDGRRASARGAVNFAPLCGILFGGAGSQASLGQPLFASIPGRGRYSAPRWHVPKVEMYVRLREKNAANPATAPAPTVTTTGKSAVPEVHTGDSMYGQRREA